MTRDAADEMPRDVTEALQFLNDFAASPVGSCMFLPGLHRVQALNRGQGGWVRLAFFGYSEAGARELVSQLLGSGPDLVDPRDADVAFEGAPEPPEDGTAGVLAKQRPLEPRPSQRAAGGEPTH